MTGGRVARALSLALVLSAGAARAGDACATGAAAAEPAVPPEVVAELVGWIARTTMYDVGTTWRDPPEIAFCAVGTLIDYEGRALIVDPALRAAYDLPARRIHLVLPWSAEDLYDRSVLLHELVHDVQFANRDWDCPGAPEVEAYALQDRWLQEHGILVPFDWAAIGRLARCPPGDGG